MSMLRALLTVINTVIGEDYRISAYLDPLLEIVGPTADDLVRNMHAVADDYATRTLTYLAEHPGGRDQSMAAAGTIVIDATRHAASELSSFGYPALEHDAEDTTRAAGCTAIAVLVWAQVVLGHIEADRLMRKARTRPGITG